MIYPSLKEISGRLLEIDVDVTEGNKECSLIMLFLWKFYHVGDKDNIEMNNFMYLMLHDYQKFISLTNNDYAIDNKEQLEQSREILVCFLLNVDNWAFFNIRLRTRIAKAILFHGIMCFYDIYIHVIDYFCEINHDSMHHLQMFFENLFNDEEIKKIEYLLQYLSSFIRYLKAPSNSKNLQDCYYHLFYMTNAGFNIDDCYKVMDNYKDKKLSPKDLRYLQKVIDKCISLDNVDIEDLKCQLIDQNSILFWLIPFHSMGVSYIENYIKQFIERNIKEENIFNLCLVYIHYAEYITPTAEVKILDLLHKYFNNPTVGKVCIMVHHLTDRYVLPNIRDISAIYYWGELFPMFIVTLIEKRTLENLNYCQSEVVFTILHKRLNRELYTKITIDKSILERVQIKNEIRSNFISLLILLKKRLITNIGVVRIINDFIDSTEGIINQHIASLSE